METLEELRQRVEQTEQAIRDDFDRQAIARAGDSMKNAPQPAQRQKQVNGKKRQCPSLYLILVIGPSGLKFSAIQFAAKKPKPYDYTHGEGQCLIFKLNDFDCSPQFADALWNGEFYKTVSAKILETDFSTG